jgi:putative ABC transport system permease protein
MNRFKLVWAFISRKPLTWAFHALALALGVAVVTALLLVQEGLESRFKRDLADIDLVIGAKGSPLQLVLSSVFALDVPTGNIPLSEAERFSKHPLVKRAVPVSLGDNAMGFRIVGTSRTYPDIYGATLDVGTWWSQPMEAVLGSDAARAMKIRPGDSFFGEHGMSMGGEAHKDAAYRVTGILKPTGTVLDRMVLTDTESVWKVHEEAHGVEGGAAPHAHEEHESDAHAHDAGEPHVAAEPAREVTSLLVTYKSVLGAVMVPREVQVRPDLQPAGPAIEVARLNRLLGNGGDVLQGFGVGLLVLAGLGFVLTLATAVGQRASQLALLRVLGARPFMLFSLVTIEALLLGLLAGVAGLGLGWGAATFAAQTSVNTGGPVLALPPAGLREVWILGGALAISLVAALGPAIAAYRTDPARVLKGG